MTIKRIKDFTHLEQQLIKIMYEDVKNKYRDGQWREYKTKLKIKDRWYGFECEFRLDDMFLTFGRKTIVDGQDKIIVPYGGKLN